MRTFYKPDEFSDGDEDVIEINGINADNLDDNAELITFQIDEGDSDSDVEVLDAAESDTDDSDMESDTSVEDDTPSDRNIAGRSDRQSPHSSVNDVNEEEDDVVQAIIAATKKVRAHPPDIVTEDFIVDLSFHPNEDILAVGTINGDVIVYRYSNEENKLLHNIEVHTKAVRDIEFNLDGSTLFSVSKDKSVMMLDTATGKFKRYYDNAHDTAIYKMHVLCENLFATGDDDGTVKLWDLREKEDKPIFALKEVDDYISAILTNQAKKVLLTTSGDGFLTAINIGARKLYVQSEPYDEELTCMGLFRRESKLVVGTSKGRLYTFAWDEFGLHSNMFPGPKSPMSLMVPITERIAVVGGEEGILRAMHVVPGRNLGIVGQHSLGVEAMDISGNGELIASSSHDNDIKFWNIKYFEDFDEMKYNEKHHKIKEQRHNLPSSKFANAGDFFADLA
ncbi:WD repeat-containing protein 55 like [Pseudolycoriella hygida]|uniref:WD repeat-containing protein 55 homolog n=1 Tax=Pseudolycoriella hygida TaxID=35572 RepID=A0A9Q0MKB0_9DIPT|nr:WD repeat-containing protein 55 like [Pseudolycoriella hygida]